MISVYWSAQFIPSGWISVIFGLSPLFTALMAQLWLDGEKLTPARVAGMVTGIAGLLVIFSSSFSLNDKAAFGVLGMLVSVAIHCGSAVWIKRLNAGVPAIVMTSGGLLFAAPLFIFTWVAAGAEIPGSLSVRTLGAIGYLAMLGSVLGFALYYYVLNQVEATRVALLTLITPICALFIGHLFNDEPLTLNVVAGSLLILSGLALFEFSNQAGRIRARFLRY